MPIFVQKFTSYKLLYKTLVDCDSQPLETLEWSFVSKDFCIIFTGFYIAIHMGPLAIYMSQVLHPTCPKISNFQNDEQVNIKEVRHPSCLISSFPIFQPVDMLFSPVREPTCPPDSLNLFFDIFKSCPVFVMTEFWVSDNMSTLPM